MEILENMDPFLKTFWFVAIPASLVFIIQTFMTFLGTDAMDGTEADFDGDLAEADTPFQLFSLRNLINFLLGFSWTGIAFYDTIPGKLPLLLLAVGVGALFVYLFFLIIRQVQKLAEDNTFKIIQTLDKTAEVYLPVPENMSGKGKVLVSVNGSVHELDAMTTAQQRIPTNTIVKVVRIADDKILIVETL